jgi:GntR family transcriptional regulator
MSSVMPLYAQLKETIIADISSGVLVPGDQLPSQRELCRRYEMSHMTVRRALDELKNEGVIQAIAGKGFFVAERKQTAEVGSLNGFAEHMHSLGLMPKTQVLKAELIPASTLIAKHLRIDIGAEVAYLHRLRYVDDRPFSLTTAYLVHRLCPGILEHDLENESLFTTLREVYDLHPTSSTSFIEAQLATEDTAAQMGLTLPEALLVKEQITYTQTGQAIEFSRSLLRGERYHLRVDEGDTASGRLLYEAIEHTSLR